MNQTDRGAYRKKESTFKQFRHSFLGKIVIAAAILILVLLFAIITNPSYPKMKDKMEDNIKQSIWSRDSITADGLDIFMSCIGHTFSRFSDEVTPDMKRRWELFIENADTSSIHAQELGYKDHLFYSTLVALNNKTSEEVTCGLGIFGLVIPLVDFNEFLPRLSPPVNYENPQLIQNGGDDEYFGETHVDVFHYQGDPSN